MLRRLLIIVTLTGALLPGSPATAAPVVTATAAGTPTVSPVVQSGPRNLVTRKQDTYITTADSADHSAGAFLHIGLHPDSKKKYRSLLQFDLTKLPRSTVITKASLRLYNSWTGSCDGWWMYATPIAAAWNQSTVTWANQPGTVADTSLQASAFFGIGNATAPVPCPDHPNFVDPSTSDGLQRLDVTRMVQRWVSGGLANHGIMLSAGESDSKAYKDFCAMNPGPVSATDPCTVAYHIPTLEIEFNTGRSVIATTNGHADTKAIELYDGSDPAAWDTAGPFQRWAPDKYHSITDTNLVPAGTWGGGVDVKLRPAGHYGSGQVMVVADNRSGFVGVVPYPALAGRKFGVNVGGTGVSNVHGAELMPDGNVAVALSLSGKVQVYSAAQGQNWPADRSPLTEVALPGAHQVLYDPAGPWLWAIGDNLLVKYRYTAGALSVLDSYEIPRQLQFAHDPPAYGHDISHVSGDANRLWVAANAGIIQFAKTEGGSCAVNAGGPWPDPASSGVGTRWCADHPNAAVVNATRMAKSIADDPATGRVARVYGNINNESNGSAVQFIDPGNPSVTDGAGVSAVYYKARWMVPAY
ncbi:DUF6528 family protein [Actinoplanes sp. NPDC024001]|uniref:DUF6528 family protein n=1 Tax=Actinoplanes sp. NPDC024001 TaxID=3154598 RepID=UPI0034067033